MGRHGGLRLTATVGYAGFCHSRNHQTESVKATPGGNPGNRAPQCGFFFPTSNSPTGRHRSPQAKSGKNRTKCKAAEKEFLAGILVSKGRKKQEARVLLLPGQSWRSSFRLNTAIYLIPQNLRFQPVSNLSWQGQHSKVARELGFQAFHGSNGRKIEKLACSLTVS